jgi:hypothetical protein
MHLPKPSAEYYEIDRQKHRVTRVIDYRGSEPPIPEKPLVTQCDFCVTMADRLWCRLVLPVGVIFSPIRNMVYHGGYWRSCVYCEALISPRLDIRSLVARVRTINPETRIVPNGVLEIIYQVVLVDARADDKVLEWGAGQILPVDPWENQETTWEING